MATHRAPSCDVCGHKKPRGSPAPPAAPVPCAAPASSEPVPPAAPMPCEPKPDSCGGRWERPLKRLCAMGEAPGAPVTPVEPTQPGGQDASAGSSGGVACGDAVVALEPPAGTPGVGASVPPLPSPPVGVVDVVTSNDEVDPAPEDGDGASESTHGPPGGLFSGSSQQWPSPSDEEEDCEGGGGPPGSETAEADVAQGAGAVEVEGGEGGWESLLADFGLEVDTPDDLSAAAGGAGQMDAPQAEERVKRRRWELGALRYGEAEELVILD